MTHQRYLTRVLAVGLAAVTVTACGSSESRLRPGVLKVVAGENFWGDIAGQLGGAYVHVTSILTEPNADPHLYEATASDAAAVTEASLVVENGGGYDGWLTQLVSSTSHAGRVVVDVQGVLKMSGGDVNPHFWYDIPEVPHVAAAIEAALSKLEPRHSGTFSANLAAFDASLGPVEALISRIHRRYAGEPVGETERLAGYLVQAAGLQVRSPAGFATAIEDGNEPSPADAVAMQRVISEHRIRVLLYNTQTVSPVTQQVENMARASGVPVVGLTETMPPSYSTYQAWQLAQTEALLGALGGTAP